MAPEAKPEGPAVGYVVQGVAALGGGYAIAWGLAAFASIVLRRGVIEPQGSVFPSLWLQSGSCGTVAVQGNLTV